MRPLPNTPPVTWTRMRTRTRMRTNFGGRSMKTQNPPSPFRRMLKTLSVYLRTPEYVRSHNNCIVYPKFEDSAAVHYKVQYIPYFTTVRIIRTSITLPGTVLYTWHIRTRYQVPGKIYLVRIWYLAFYRCLFTEFCKLVFFRVRTEPYPGYSYPCPEIL